MNNCSYSWHFKFMKWLSFVILNCGGSYIILMMYNYNLSGGKPVWYLSHVIYVYLCDAYMFITLCINNTLIMSLHLLNFFISCLCLYIVHQIN